MHPYKRSTRVGELLKQEISHVILHKLKDPRVGFVTVTDVDLSHDLKNARVFVSVLQRETEEESILALNSAAGFIKHEVSFNVRLRSMPAIRFFSDKSLDYGEKIDTLLKKIKGDEEGDNE